MRKRCYTEQQFIEAVKDSYSVAGVLDKLHLKPAGGNYKTVHNLKNKLNLDTSHWTGAGHLRGKTHNWAIKISLEDILVADSTYTSSDRLKKRLIAAGILRNECYICGQLPFWNGQKMVLVLDHKNGINNDNRKKNLRLVCPNCNSQLPTHAGRNKGKYHR